MRAVVTTLLIASLLAGLIPLLAPGNGDVDLLAYWSAAHLLVSGRNPYDAQALGQPACGACRRGRLMYLNTRLLAVGA